MPAPPVVALEGLDPMERLIVRLARRDSLGPLEDRVYDLLARPGAANTFSETAIRLGVRGLALERLSRARSPESGPTGPLQEILKALTNLRRHAVLWELEEERILSRLDREGLRPLVLKGGALRHHAYGAPAERIVGDLDLLSRQANVAPLMDVMRSLGYASEYSARAREGFRTHHYHERLAHPNGFVVEVHWGLTRPAALCGLDPEAFHRRARTSSTRGGTPMRMPSPEHMILHTLSQIEQERCRKLSRIVDLDRVVATSPDLDWAYLTRQADASNLGVVLALSFRLAELLLRTDAPEVLLTGSELGASTRVAIEALRPVEHLVRPSTRARVASDDLFWIWCLPDRRLRSSAIRRLAWGTTDPLLWVWEEREGPDADGQRRGRGPARASKMVAYQLWLAARLLTMRLRRAMGGREGFWKRPGPGSREERTS